MEWFVCSLLRRHHRSSIRTWQDAVALLGGAAVYFGMRILLEKRALVREERTRNAISLIAAIVVMVVLLFALDA